MNRVGRVDDEYEECERCGKRKPDVRETDDPYQAEVNDEHVTIRVCDDCYDDIAEDI